MGLIDSDQAGWWSEDWQRKEREAKKDIQEGKLKKFLNIRYVTVVGRDWSEYLTILTVGLIDALVVNIVV